MGRIGSLLPLSPAASSFRLGRAGAGRFVMAQNVSSYWNYYCGYVTVSNGATFHPAQRAAGYTGSGAYTYLRGLFGEGDVELNQVLTLTLMGESQQRTSEFSGRISPSIPICAQVEINFSAP